jgi:hypothetical protein
MFCVTALVLANVSHERIKYLEVLNGCVRHTVLLFMADRVSRAVAYVQLK